MCTEAVVGKSFFFFNLPELNRVYWVVLFICFNYVK